MTNDVLTERRSRRPDLSRNSRFFCLTCDLDHSDLHLPRYNRNWVNEQRVLTVDAKYFRERAELCSRLADGLSLNNPGRTQ